MRFDEISWNGLPDTGAMRRVKPEDLYQFWEEIDDPKSTQEYPTLPLPTASGWQRKTSPLKKTPWQALVIQWSSRDVVQRLEAIRAIKQAGKEDCLEAQSYLRDALGDESERVRAVAAEALGILEGAAPVDALLCALTDLSWDVRAAAAQSLGNMGKWTPIKHLITLFGQERDENVREAIVRSLGRQGHQMPVGMLIDVLRRREENWLVREAAAWALGELGEDAPVVPLREVLVRDQDEFVRAAAARALGQAGDPDALPLLLQALDDSSEAVCDAAIWALQQLDTETRGIERHEDANNFDESLVDWLSATWFAQGARLSQQEYAFLALTRFISDKKGWVRNANIRHSPRGPVLFLDCFYESSGSFFQEETIQPIKDSRLLEPVEAALNDRDTAVREVAHRVFEMRKQRPWFELFIVSFAVAHPVEKVAAVPLRVVVSGMGCQRVRKHDANVLDQLVDKWVDMVEEPLVCERPHDLADLRIWYQPPTGNEQREFVVG